MDRTEKELTEAAARAVGVAVDWAQGAYWIRETHGAFQQARGFMPLLSDETAFRVMVALNMRPEPSRTTRGSYDRVSVTIAGRGHVGAVVMYGSDPRAAWRRAIVETAAALVADITGE
jgi:hypothetical protein